jgi:hypothetical protein
MIRLYYIAAIYLLQEIVLKLSFPAMFNNSMLSMFWHQGRLPYHSW